MRKVSKIGVAAAGLVLAGGAAAAAVTAPPETADDGLTKAEEKAGFEVPANEDHPTSDDRPGEGQDHPGGGQSEDSGLDDAAEGTHGADVSAVAKDDSTTGREHGAAVSEAARDNHGQAHENAAVETPNGGGTGTADDASDGASEQGTSKAADQAGLGSGNAGDHGKP